MHLHSVANLILAAIFAPSVAHAQLADGTYTTRDTLNANTGSATASTGPSGVNLLKFEYTKNGTTHIVNLAWNRAQYVAGTEKRFYTLITDDGKRWYWYETKDAAGNWVTQSSGRY